MKLSYILEWIKRAYPGIRELKVTKDTIFYSRFGTTIDLKVDLSTGDIIFPLLGKPRDEGKVKLFAGSLWGSPRKTDLKEIENWTPGGPKRRVFSLEEPIIPKKSSLALGNSLGQQEILRYLTERLPKISPNTLPSGAIQIGSDGPVLGRFGLCPNPKETYHYIPYGHSERIKEVITKYLEKCFSTGQP